MSRSWFHPGFGSTCCGAILRALPHRAAMPCAIAIGALVAGTAALPLQAAPTAVATFSAEVTLAVTTPAGLQYQYNNPFPDAPFYAYDDRPFAPPTQTGSGSQSWSASGEGPQPDFVFGEGPAVTSEPVDPEIDGAIVLNLDIEASSGPAEGSAFVDATVETSLNLRNFGDEGLTVDLLLSYDFMRSTNVADPLLNTALAVGGWTLYTVTFAGMSGGSVVENFLTQGSLTTLGPDLASEDGFEHSFIVGAGDQVQLNFLMYGTAETSTTVAPIPLPAAGWLLLGGLGGLGFAARRKRRKAA